MVQADDKELVGDGADATRLVFKVADKFGAERAFGGGDVKFELKGPGTIIGDNPFALGPSGGVGAVWVRTQARGAGVIEITATHSSLGSRTIRIKVTRTG